MPESQAGEPREVSVGRHQLAAVLDGDGRVVTSLKNGEFESAAKIGMSDVTGFLERWKPGAPKAVN